MNCRRGYLWLIRARVSACSRLKSNKTPGLLAEPRFSPRQLKLIHKPGRIMMNNSISSSVYFSAIGAALLAGMCQSADAATLCVNPSGSGGCYTTIGAAVAAATAGDTIQVAPGKYF